MAAVINIRVNSFEAFSVPTRLEEQHGRAAMKLHYRSLQMCLEKTPFFDSHQNTSHLGSRDSSRRAADEEPLVDGRVDLLRGKVLVRGQRGELLRGDTAGGVRDSDVGAKKVVSACIENQMATSTYVETPPGWVLPVIRRSQASAHSRTTSMAYLLHCQ